MGGKVFKFLLLVLLVYPLNELPAQKLRDRLKAKQTDASQQKAEVVVPNVVGMNQSDAESTITKAGLKLGKIVERETKYPNGQVVRQQPAADSRVSQGSAVGLMVSKNNGVAPTITTTKSTPDGGTKQTGITGVTLKSEWFSGMAKSVAPSIRATGLTVQVKMTKSEQPRGSILSLNSTDRTLAAGEVLRKEEPIIMEISGGPDYKPLTGGVHQAEEPDQPGGLMPAVQIITTNTLIMTGKRVQSQTIGTQPMQMTGIRAQSLTITTDLIQMTGKRVQSQTITTQPVQMTGMRVESQTITTQPIQMTGKRVQSQTITTQPIRMTGMR